MNLGTVFINCLYLLGSSIVIYIIVNLWLEIWLNVKMQHKLSKHKLTIINTEKELHEFMEEVRHNESDSSSQRAPRE